MRVQVQLDGLNQLLRQLSDTQQDAEQAALEVVSTLAEDTRAKAVQGIQRGPKSGAVYQRYSPRRVHQASAPGQYPATDTGRLVSSVRAELPTLSNLTAHVGTDVTYGAYLEFGTSRMAPRPWLVPSFELAKIGVEKRLKAAFERRAGR